MDSLSAVVEATLEFYRSATLQNRVLAWVSLAVGVLLLVTVLFSAYTLWLRVRNALQARKWKRREARWTGITLEALTGERSPDEVAERVGQGEEPAFLDFLLRYARRVRGEERDRVRSLAVPFLNTLEPRFHDRDPYVRAHAVQTLGTLGLSERADILVRAVADESPFVSMLAARALADYGGAKYMTPVLANLERFEQWGTEYVTSLLVSLGPDAAPGIRAVLEDPDHLPRIRAAAADALTRLHDLPSVSTALRVLESDPPPDVAVALLRVLAVLGGPDQLSVVRTRLEDPHFAVRAEAYSALGALGGDADRERLDQGLEDESPWVVLHAARALRERGAEAELYRLARSDHPAALAAGQVLAEE